jgi:hypothetical protein
LFGAFGTLYETTDSENNPPHVEPRNLSNPMPSLRKANHQQLSAMNPILAALLGPVSSLIARLIPDPQAQADAQLKLAQMAQNGDLAELNAAVQVILAEATGNTLQRSWRPLLMLFFAGLVGARWFGYSAPNMSEAEVMKLWDIVQLGIGGYTIGRSVEKVAPSIANALKK